MKIVLIDDSVSNLVVLRHLCQKVDGAECVTYTDAEQALGYLFANDVAMIILDYSMPRITGVEMVKRLRGSARHGKTPIVMVTGSTELAVRNRAVEVGANDFIVKPIKAADYVKRLQTMLDTSDCVSAEPM